MKLRNLFMAVIAGAAMLVGCNKEVDLGPAKLDVSTSQLELGQGEASRDVTFTATRDWVISGIPDWVAVSAEEGVASPDPQTVTVAVNANTGFNRRADLIFTIGFARQALTIIQEGPEGAKTEGMGTKEDPYTIAGVKEYIGTLGGATSPVKVYIKGKISAIKEEFSAQYGNGNFTISEDGSTTGDQFTAYRVLYLGNQKWKEGDTQIKVGDEVVVFGNVVLYNGTYETSQGNAFLYELNGVNKGGDEGGQGGGESADPTGTGTLEDPFNVAAAIAKAVETGQTATEQEYYIKGKVASVSSQFSADFGNVTFTMVDEGASAVFTAYRVLYLGNKKWTEGDKTLNEGDEVVVCAKIINFKGNTPETSGGYVYSINGDNGGATPQPGGDETAQGSGTEADPYNPKAANAYIATLAADTESDTDIYIKGKISKIANNGEFNAQYGNASFYISADGTEASEQFYVFRTLYLGNRKWVDGDTQIKVGDEVVICGKVVYYKGNTPETAANKSYIFSLNAGGGDTPGGEGDGTEANPYTPAAANAYVSALAADTESENDVFVKGKICKITNEFGAQYGNATFYISADGTEAAEQFYVFRALYLNNQKWVEGDTQIKVGDEVVICGKVVNYKGTTPETVANKAYLFSLNAGGTEPTPSGDAGTATNPFTVAQAIAKAQETGETATADVFYIKGKVAVVSLSAQYKNADLDLVDTDGGPVFKAFRIKGFDGADITGNEPIAVGDEVVVCGNIVNYKGNTPETTQGGKLVTWNGKTSFDGGTEPGGDTPGGDTPGDVDFSKATTIKLTNESTWAAETDATYKAGFATTASNGIKVGVYKHTSTSTIVEPDQYNAKVYKSAVIAISAPAGHKILGVRFKANDYNSGQYCKDLTELEPGTGTLTADTGTMMIGDWTGSADKVVFQAAAAQARLVEAYVVLDGESGGDTPGGDTPGGDTPEEPKLPVNDGLTEDTAFTVQDAIYVAKNGTEDKEYYVKAVVGKDITIKNGTASFELVDGTTDGKLTVVKAKSFGGAAFEGTEPLEWLDEVVLKGKVSEYSTLPALLNGVFVKWNGNTSFTDETGGGEPSVANDGLTLETAFTASEANAWVLANLTSGQNTGDAKYYVKGKVQKYYQKSGTDQNFTNNSYHQATFYITDDGNASDASFEAYQINYLEGKTWEEGQTDVVVGDEVILYGPLARYNDIAETQGAGKAFLYSLNGKTKVEVPANDGSSVEKAFTASEANAWVLANLTSGQNTGDAKYYVKGKVQKYYQKSGTDQNFTNNSYHQATFYITDDGNASDASFEAYQINYLEGKTWEEGQTDVVVGDEVILYGPLARYNDIAETQGAGKAFLYSLNGVTTAPATGGGDEPTGGDDPAGNNPVSFEFSSKDAVTLEGITISFDKGAGSTAPAWNTNYSELRLYAKNTISISSEANMAKVEFYFHKQGQKVFQTISMTSAEGTYTDCEESTSATDSKKATWEGTSKSIVLTLGDTTGGQRVLEKVLVTLQ